MRYSQNEVKDGKIINGFDYDKQVWIIDGVYQNCGHPKDMDCNCYGRQHKGQVVI